MRTFGLGLAAVMAVLLTAGPAQSRHLRELEPASFVPGRVVVRFAGSGPHALEECAEALTRSGTPLQTASADASDSLDRVHRRLRVRAVRALFRRPDGTPLSAQRARLRRRFAARDLAHVYAVKLGAGVSVREAVAAYRADPHVLFAQPDYRIRADHVPDDPFFASSGAWGQSYRDLWGLVAIDAPRAWDTTFGQGGITAVVDSGLDYDHPDIAANVWINPGEDLDGNGRYDASDLNGIDDDGNGFVDDLRGFDFANSLDENEDGDFLDPNDVHDNDPFDDNGHGTHVSGTIAAVGDNGIGISGVAPQTRIMAVKGLGATGGGSSSGLAQAIVYAARNGASVVNNSWSCTTRCPTNPVVEDAVRLAHELDVVIVFSAGNRTDQVLFFSPQNMRETLSVGATNELDGATGFSNRGLLMDVGAPGGGSPAFSVVNILSLLSAGASPARAPFVVQDDYLRLAGTSMSAPHVSGVAALVRAAHPALDADQVRRLLRRSSDDLGTPGHDAAFGAGRVNAARAVEHGGVPDIALRITAPGRTTVVSQVSEVIDVVGTAAGADLAAVEVAFGIGLEPAAWTPLEDTRLAVQDGVIARWPIAELDDGTYALRLRGTDDGGQAEAEFATLSLERNPSQVVPSPGPGTGLMGVSGDFVSWVSQRRGPMDDTGEVPAGSLFVTDLARGTENLIASGPNGRAFGTMSGRRLTWLEFPPRPEPDPNTVVDPNDPPPPPPGIVGFTCRYAPSSARCPLVELPIVGNAVSGPDVSRDRIVWSDRRNESADLFHCRIRGRKQQCNVRPLVDAPGDQAFATLDRDRMVWMDLRTGRIELFGCEIDPVTAACASVLIETDAVLPVLPELSGRLLAFQDVSKVPLPLLLCEVDLDTGACDSIEVTRRFADSPVSLSGQRLVWEDRASLGDDLDVFFCEYDSATRTCPPQRLTGEFSNQSVPRIDGNRIAWEDARTGTFQVATFELPVMARIRDRTGVEGRPLVIAVRAHDPVFGPVELRAELADGQAIATVGARFLDTGSGFGLLIWRPNPGQAGSYAFRFTAKTLGRLETYESVRVRVRERRRPWWWFF